VLHPEFSLINSVCETTPQIMFWTPNGLDTIYEAIFDWLITLYILTRSAIGQLAVKKPYLVDKTKDFSIVYCFVLWLSYMHSNEVLGVFRTKLPAAAMCSLVLIG